MTACSSNANVAHRLSSGLPLTECEAVSAKKSKMLEALRVYSEEQPADPEDALCERPSEGIASMLAAGGSTSMPQKQHAPVFGKSRESVDSPHSVGDIPSSLNAQNPVTADAASGCKAMNSSSTATKTLLSRKDSRRDVAMPAARTDLTEIFQSDEICVICRPKSMEEDAVSLDTDRAAKKLGMPEDVGLQRLIAHWPKLPGKIQAAVLGLVDAALAKE